VHLVGSYCTEKAQYIILSKGRFRPLYQT